MWRQPSLGPMWSLSSRLRWGGTPESRWRPVERLPAARQRHGSAPCVGSGQGAPLQPRRHSPDARPPSLKVHLHEGHVGGGFGVRGELYPEDVLVPSALLPSKRHPLDRGPPRAPSLRPTTPETRFTGCGQRLAPGEVRGIEDAFWLDQGAYLRTHAATVADLTAAMLPVPTGCLRIGAWDASSSPTRPPAGTYRAPGRYEGSFQRAAHRCNRSSARNRPGGTATTQSHPTGFHAI